MMHLRRIGTGRRIWHSFGKRWDAACGRNATEVYALPPRERFGEYRHDRDLCRACVRSVLRGMTRGLQHLGNAA